MICMPSGVSSTGRIEFSAARNVRNRCGSFQFGATVTTQNAELSRRVDQMRRLPAGPLDDNDAADNLRVVASALAHEGTCDAGTFPLRGGEPLRDEGAFPL